MNKLTMVYHEQTNTYWVNDVNWKERYKTESMNWGHVQIDTNNIFDIKRLMNEDGFELVKKDDLPSWAK